jgi:hypothetical protein
MADKDKVIFAWVVGPLIGLLLGGLVFGILAARITRGGMMHSAITHEFAYWHPETAEFTWKTKLEVVEEKLQEDLDAPEL